jgi:hypothetical protein
MLTVCSNYRGPDRGAGIRWGGAAGRLVPASGLGRRGRAGPLRSGRGTKVGGASVGQGAVPGQLTLASGSGLGAEVGELGKRSGAGSING